MSTHRSHCLCEPMIATPAFCRALTGSVSPVRTTALVPDEFVPIRLPMMAVALTPVPESSIPAVMLPEMVLPEPGVVPPIVFAGPPLTSTPISLACDV